MEISGFCKQGFGRSKNEDAILIAGNTLRNNICRETIFQGSGHTPFFLAVADGLGGHPGGDLASFRAHEEMRASTDRMPPALKPDQVKEWWQNEIKMVYAKIRSYADAMGKPLMATTFSGLLFYGSQVFLMHIGDSRIYHWRKKRINRITTDHTLQDQFKDASIPGDILINCLGGMKEPILEWQVLSTYVFPYDKLLLVSDGVTKLVSDEVLGELLSDDAPAQKLLNYIEELLPNDDYSAIIVTGIEAKTQ